MNTPLIIADHIWVQVPTPGGVKVILEDVSLSLMPGKIMTLIGPNGAGKTTLLKVMLNLIPVSRGKLTRKSGLKIGYMPQKLDINPTLPMTVERLLSLGTPERTSKIQSQIDNCLKEVGAFALKHSRLTVLSGGEMQRVMLARALLISPDLLVLDEPMQGVDVLGQEELYQLIAKIRDNRGCSVLLVSHDLHLVMAASDEVVCLNTHVCCSGHPSKVSVDPSYQKLFVAPYKHDHDHLHAGGCVHD
ncbi:MAG: metal ABC transporter ATP-binding protein [Alphaproteobacteria bacterium]|nr:metal ABC transporter ATP-binding protein [Alphaproteobacteria bacterium]